jgi:hypothetical protein
MPVCLYVCLCVCIAVFFWTESECFYCLFIHSCICIVVGYSIIARECCDGLILTLPHISVYAKPAPEFTTKYVVISVGGVEWFEVGCSCWYWWNCWRSLIKLSFRNRIYSIIYISLYKTIMHIGWLTVKHIQY